MIFMAPWLLLSLIVLPVLWWLLRLTPPTPRRLNFPPVRFLHDVVKRQETAAHTPWWLIMLRIILVGLIIIALARPVLNPVEEIPHSGKNLLLVIDDSWAAARDWQQRQQAVLRVVDQAQRSDKHLFIIQTAPPEDGGLMKLLGPLRPAEARGIAEAMVPKSWPADHVAVQALLRNKHKDLKDVYAVWFSDGLGDFRQPDVTEGLARDLQNLGGLTVLRDRRADSPHLLRPPVMDGSRLVLKVQRVRPAPGEYRRTIMLQAKDGRFLQRGEAVFEARAREAEVTFDILPQIRNDIDRVVLKEEQSAGATVLMDSRWQRHTVGLVARHGEEKEKTLLGELYYLTRALAPFAEVYDGSILNVLKQNPSVVVLPDIGVFSKNEREQLEAWVKKGGVLLRFAGPRMASHTQVLTPVPLRNGERNLEGSLSWTEPAGLADFPDGSPFFGLDIPDDIVIHKQVLAEPAPDLPVKTWARLTDGTPLITGDNLGQGWVVLIHTTASPDWSNLSLSGLFVEILQRSLNLGSGAAHVASDLALRPQQVLNAYGYLATPSVTVLPIKAAEMADMRLGPTHPPGFYGTERVRRAVNLGGVLGEMQPLPEFSDAVEQEIYGEAGETSLMPWLLLAALVVFAVDMLVVLWMRGGFALAPAVIAVLCLISGPAVAADPATLATQTHLAYVSTGVPSIDDITEAGLNGLTRILERRTSVELGGVVQVDVENDELSFFPLIYWPVSLDQETLNEDGIRNLQRYLANGGMVLFDTRDQQFLDEGRGQKFGVGTSHLRTILTGLDLPPLTPVPSDHVLTRSFYLLKSFPGQYTGGDLWIDVPEEQINDGVPSVLIGGHDWVGAWAIDSVGRPLNTISPGGERQREMAYRFGVNVVMMALTGNYKADQVHVPHILERLGQ